MFYNNLINEKKCKKSLKDKKDEKLKNKLFKIKTIK